MWAAAVHQRGDERFNRGQFIAAMSRLLGSKSAEFLIQPVSLTQLDEVK